MNFKVDEIELKNGAKGLLIDIANTKAMHFNLSFRAGDYLCPKEKEQTAHVLEHMMFKANEVYHDQKYSTTNLAKTVPTGTLLQVLRILLTWRIARISNGREFSNS